MRLGQITERRTTFLVLLVVGTIVILFGVSIALTYLGNGPGGITRIF